MGLLDALLEGEGDWQVSRRVVKNIVRTVVEELAKAKQPFDPKDGNLVAELVRAVTSELDNGCPKVCDPAPVLEDFTYIVSGVLTTEFILDETPPPTTSDDIDEEGTPHWRLCIDRAKYHLLELAHKLGPAFVNAAYVEGLDEDEDEEA